MNKFILKNQITFLFLLIFCTRQQCEAQVTVNANSNNYSVSVFMYPVAVLPSTYSCGPGYNYNIQLSYVISIGGNNPPSSLHLLQGTIGCGSNSLFFNLPNSGGSGLTTTNSNPWRSVPDCAIVNPIILGCNTINLQMQGPSLPYRVVNFAVSAVPLSVKLTDFSAFASSNNVKLKWETATETNNDRIIIQRSGNAADWSDIDSVKGAGVSFERKNYQFTDRSLQSGRYFYKLKFISTDGQSSYSEVKTVKLDNEKKFTISAFPIPNNTDIINLNGIPSTGSTILILKNMYGSVLHQTKITTEKIILPSLVAGTYFLQVINEQESVNETLKYIRL